jgi:hypothetical protein
MAQTTNKHDSSHKPGSNVCKFYCKGQIIAFAGFLFLGGVPVLNILKVGCTGFTGTDHK